MYRTQQLLQANIFVTHSPYSCYLIWRIYWNSFFVEEVGRSKCKSRSSREHDNISKCQSYLIPSTGINLWMQNKTRIFRTENQVKAHLGWILLYLEICTFRLHAWNSHYDNKEKELYNQGCPKNDSLRCFRCENRSSFGEMSLRGKRSLVVTRSGSTLFGNSINTWYNEGPCRYPVTSLSSFKACMNAIRSYK